MTASLAPGSVAELVEAVRSRPRLLPIGAGTKPRLASVCPAAERLSLGRLSGLLQYDPSEFMFTALAGTPLREIAAALAERGQYLPFDPPLADHGATLGGTVAAGLSGPGRLRFGGARDFILAVRFVDGAGRLMLLGGKVVKNAAGFDVPKFLVGSLGRFGVLAELTFKVFPQPVSRLTLRLTVASMAEAAGLLMAAAGGRWEAEALEVPPGVDAVYVRLSGPSAALEPIAKEMLARWPGEIVSPPAAAAFWAETAEFTWAHPQGNLVKVVLTPNLAAELERAISGMAPARLHLSAGGHVAFISLPAADAMTALDEQLNRLGLAGLTLRGEGRLWLGKQARPAIVDAVKRAFDPDNRFPALDD